MKYKSMVAFALAGSLACVNLEARTTQILNPTGWSGGTTIIGNMRAVAGKKKYSLNRYASNLKIIGESMQTSRVGYGIIFDHSSARNVVFSDTIFDFGAMSSSIEMTGIYLKSDGLLLGFDAPETTHVSFNGKIYGKNVASGFVMDNSDLWLESGAIAFNDAIESHGIAHGMWFKNATPIAKYIRITSNDLTRTSTTIRFGRISGGQEAYGIRYTNNQTINTLEIQNINKNNAYAEVIFSLIDGNNTAAMLSADGATNLNLSHGRLRGDTTRSNGSSSLIHVSNGSFTLTLNKHSFLGGNEVRAVNNAHGFRFDGGTAIGIDARINIYDHSSTGVTNIQSKRGNAYGIYTNKSLSLNAQGDGSIFYVDSIYSSNSNTAYGIETYSNTTSLTANNGGAIWIGTIQGGSAYGIESDYNLYINPHNNSAIRFVNINATGNGSAIGMITQQGIEIRPKNSGQLVFENITARAEAIGISAPSRLIVDFTGNTNQLDKTSQVMFQNIVSKENNAIGIYTKSSRNEFTGSGKTIFENIKYTGGNNQKIASGILANKNPRTYTLAISKESEVIFKNINSQKSAYGIQAASFELATNKGVLEFGDVRGNTEATGIKATQITNSQLNNQSALVMNNISTRDGKAYGMIVQGNSQLQLNNSRYEAGTIFSTNGSAGLIHASSGSLLVANKSSLTLQEARGNIEANGVKFDKDFNFKVEYSSNTRFSRIASSNGEASGIKAGTKAVLWSREKGSIVFDNIEASQNASWIIAPNIQATIENQSNIKVADIRSTSNNGLALGLKADSASITILNNGQMYLGNIISNGEANGMRIANNLAIDFTKATQTDRVLFQNIQSTNGNALGMYFYANNATASIQGSGSNIAFKNIAHRGDSSNHFSGGIVADGNSLNLKILNGNRVWFDNLVSESGSTYGLKTNSLILTLDQGSELHFINLAAKNLNVGIWANNGSHIEIKGGGKIFFNTMSGSDVMGIRTWTSTLDINNTEIIFGKKNDSKHYAIYNSIANLRHSFGDTTINIDQDNSVGIYGLVDTKVDLQGGKTMKISARDSDKETIAIDGKINFYMKGSGATLVFDSGSGHLNELNVVTNSNINLIGTKARNANSLQLRKLTVEKWNGSGANVLLYAHGTASIDTSNFDGRAYQPSGNMAWCGGSDRIIINGTDNTAKQNNTLRVALSTVDNPVKYVVLAEVKNNAKDKVIFNNLTASNTSAATTSEVGFDIADIQITRHDNGNTAYYVGKIPDKNSFRLNQQKAGKMGSAQSASASVVAANFNNLNKRMGELRENNHSHGVWARVFNGEVKSDFGFGSTSNYTTVQAGYDYNLSSNLNSNSYLGFALSYLNGKTDGVASEVKSNGVEAGVYFAYVQDSGLYTDTITKVAYTSNTNNAFDSATTMSDTNNTSFIISQEIGYQAEVTNGFFLTPQFETTYAYLGGSNMTVKENGNSLKSTQDATNAWRNRLGLQMAYKLQDEDKKFRASFYAMGSYTYDYISGGDYTFDSNSNTPSLNVNNPTGSDGRFVLNVGSNIDIKDATRLYVDFEKSFCGKINTNYQINLGVRYSFGEKAPTTQSVEKKQD